MPEPDARFRSAHLDGPRRLWMREAAARVARTRGEQTVQLELAPAAAPPTGTVLVWHRAGRDRVFPLRVGITTVGRAHENDIVFAEHWVSRRHCAVLLHADGRCEIHDLASRNTTLVNGHPVNRADLTPGDVLQVCGHRLTFRRTGADESWPARGLDETQVG
ncbi:MAG: FHA domain-containing protein [Fimbriiglobus sp.]